ncbi:hypothetical protein SAMN05216570_2784 [Dyella sp. OK004]|uniref:hypothetical protein n=1 Tax=Dyella sp. OK004 TaxID=1855292 RepID=UPI0008E03175|nr:hypothetical protein [Dyella sp. OK004]SFS13082.1 hypothetical protein SAMN05216570_2784 [Dyella sp. OK004]
MHTLMVVSGGLLLLVTFLWFGSLWGNDAAALALAAKVFVPVWLVVSLVNLWVGVSHAGYSVRDELPVLLIVFAIPAAVAAVAAWHFGHS